MSKNIKDLGGTAAAGVSDIRACGEKRRGNAAKPFRKAALGLVDVHADADYNVVKAAVFHGYGGFREYAAQLF